MHWKWRFVYRDLWFPTAVVSSLLSFLAEGLPQVCHVGKPGWVLSRCRSVTIPLSQPVGLPEIDANRDQRHQDKKGEVGPKPHREHLQLWLTARFAAFCA